MRDWFDFRQRQRTWRPARDGALLACALALAWGLPPMASRWWVIVFLGAGWLVSHLDIEALRRALRGDP